MSNAGSIAEAEALGSQLQRLGLLFHVEYKHGFRNKDYLYRHAWACACWSHIALMAGCPLLACHVS